MFAFVLLKCSYIFKKYDYKLDLKIKTEIQGPKDKEEERCRFNGPYWEPIKMPVCDFIFLLVI